MKKILFLLLLVSSSVFAQVEQGFLVGAGVGFPLQDKQKVNVFDYESYDNHKVSINGMIGYRLRFLPENKLFYDLDLKVGFGSMKTTKVTPEDWEISDVNHIYLNEKSKHEFLVPISITAGMNYRLTDKFYVGLGVAPVLYVSPQTVFDLAVSAKAGYRVAKHCELALTYQYGCFDILKHFNSGYAADGRKGHMSDLMLSVYIPF